MIRARELSRTGFDFFILVQLLTSEIVHAASRDDDQVVPPKQLNSPTSKLVWFSGCSPFLPHSVCVSFCPVGPGSGGALHARGPGGATGPHPKRFGGFGWLVGGGGRMGQVYIWSVLEVGSRYTP